MIKTTDNFFYSILKESSLLFVGFDYDDWLFRFFIRIFSNRPFELPSLHSKIMQWKYIVTGIKKEDTEKLSQDSLLRFLSRYDVKSFFYDEQAEKEFFYLLFNKIETVYPQDIIPLEHFPATAFISFPSENREIALRLAKNLTDDGIKVFVDKNEIKAGDLFDNIIAEAIKAFPVFIALISEESKIFARADGTQRYHQKEWNWIEYLVKAEPKLNKRIIPVVIDNTNWRYENFKDWSSIPVTNGEKCEGYDALKEQLLKIQYQRGNFKF